MDKAKLVTNFDREAAEDIIDGDEILSFRKGLLIKFEDKSEHEAITIVFNELILSDNMKYRQYKCSPRKVS